MSSLGPRRAAAPSVALVACLSSLLALAACGRAARPSILTANAESVSFAWDSEASNIAEVTQLAQRHCGQFGKNASLRSNSPASKSGTFFTAVYDCRFP